MAFAKGALPAKERCDGVLHYEESAARLGRLSRKSVKGWKTTLASFVKGARDER
jgi:hypothetical protein